MVGDDCGGIVNRRNDEEIGFATKNLAIRISLKGVAAEIIKTIAKPYAKRAKRFLYNGIRVRISRNRRNR